MTKVFSPKVRGSTDPDYPDCLIVPLGSAHRTFPNVSGDVPPQTYWRYSTTRRRIVSMVTIVDGVTIAWDTCGKCMFSLRRCTCREGFHASAGIWHIAGGKPKEQEATPLSPRLALGKPEATPERRPFIRFETTAPAPGQHRTGERTGKKRKFHKEEKPAFKKFRRNNR